MGHTGRNREWVQLRTLHRATVLVILPCNAAASVGNYFRAEVYRESGWNTWREADVQLRDLREAGRVAFAAVDSAILETARDDPRGAIVLETEMDRAKSPDGQDWGAPCWRWFRPTRTGRWTRLERLTDALVRGVRRVDALGVEQVLAVVNPRGYFLALAAAVAQSERRGRWVLCRPPAHPRFLARAVGAVTPLVRAAAAGVALPGGVYPIPTLWSALQDEARRYVEPVPPPWQQWSRLPAAADAQRRWETLRAAAR